MQHFYTKKFVQKEVIYKSANRVLSGRLSQIQIKIAQRGGAVFEQVVVIPSCQSNHLRGEEFIALGSALAFLAPDSSFSPSANGQSVKCIAAYFIQVNTTLEKKIAA